MWEGFGASHDGGNDSHNHHGMFSAIGAWFYRYLAGITLHGGLQSVHVWPRLQHDHALLSSVRAQVLTPKGRVEVMWSSQWQLGTLQLVVAVPANMRGRVSIEPPVAGARWLYAELDGEVLFDVDAVESASHSNSHRHTRDMQHGESNGVSWVVEESTGVVQSNMGSGRYVFSCRWQK